MIISREDEANFPTFSSIEEAREYFEQRYGDKYNRGYSEKIDDDCRCYFDDVSGQPVQLLEYDDGFIGVHVVY